MSFVTCSRCFGICEERLKKLAGFFCPAERSLRCNLIAACSYLKGSFKGDKSQTLLSSLRW